MLQAIQYQRGELKVLNQLRVPYESVYESVPTVEEGWQQIHRMKVRGAPAIAIVAALAVAVELYHLREQFNRSEEVVRWIEEKFTYLQTSRPTAVNLSRAKRDLCGLMHRFCDEQKEGEQQPPDCAKLITLYLDNAEAMLESDIRDNRSLSKYGGEFLRQMNGQVTAASSFCLLTHCNTGSLATAGYGTALGVVRYLHEQGLLEHAYCTETRPYDQGSRLTAYELLHDKIPSTLITDSMAASLMKQRRISAVVVGADRIVANGDTANKIGTYQLAVLCHYHGIPFFVCAPTTSIDPSLATGDAIEIEERPPTEVTQMRGQLLTSAAAAAADVEIVTIQRGTPNMPTWNPAFDVTPAHLITAIFTERGVATKPRGKEEFDLRAFLSIS